MRCLIKDEFTGKNPNSNVGLKSNNKRSRKKRNSRIDYATYLYLLNELLKLNVTSIDFDENLTYDQRNLILKRIIEQEKIKK